MSSEQYEGMIRKQVVKLFAAFERGEPRVERIVAYVEGLYSIPIERLERAVGWALDTCDRVPPIRDLKRVAWNGAPQAKATEEARREAGKVLAYYLAEFTMPDWYEFRRAFGFPVSAALYASLNMPVPADVTFEPPDPAWCKAQRDKARSDCREAFHRLGNKYRERLPEPEKLPATNEEIPF